MRITGLAVSSRRLPRSEQRAGVLLELRLAVFLQNRESRLVRGQGRLARRLDVLREVGLLSRLELLDQLGLHAAVGEEYLAALLGVLDGIHVLIGALAGRRDLRAEDWIGRDSLVVCAGSDVA